MKFSFNTKDAVKALSKLKKLERTALRRSFTRAAKTGVTVMSRLIAKDTGLKVGDVKKEIKTAINTENAQISVTGARIPLIKFRAKGPEPSRGQGRGVSYRLPGSKGRVKKAFIATMPSGHRGVFVRKEGADRHPIVELRGPSLPKVFDKHAEAGRTAAVESLVKNLKHEMEFAIKRAGGG